jgi:hypothetical protein
MKLYVWNSEGFPEKEGSREVGCKSVEAVKKHLKEKGGTGFIAVLKLGKRTKGNGRQYEVLEKIPIVLEDNGTAAEWGEAFEAGKHGGAE